MFNFRLFSNSYSYYTICITYKVKFNQKCTCTEDKLLLIFNAYAYFGQTGTKDRNGYIKVIIYNSKKHHYLNAVKATSKYFPECKNQESKALKTAKWIVRDSKNDVYVLSVKIYNKRAIIIRGTLGTKNFVKLFMKLSSTTMKGISGRILNYAAKKEKSLGSRIKSFLAKNKEKKLILSGHSQGGGNVYALAAHLFNNTKSQLGKKFRGNVRIVNFGAIAAGDEKFDRSFCNKIKGRNYITTAVVSKERIYDSSYVFNKVACKGSLSKKKYKICIPEQVKYCRRNYKQISLTTSLSKSKTNWAKKAKSYQKAVCKSKNIFQKLVKFALCKSAKASKFVTKALAGWEIHQLSKFAQGLAKHIC